MIIKILNELFGCSLGKKISLHIWSDWETIENANKMIDAANAMLKHMGDCEDQDHDHHGNCQTHFLEKPCSVQVFRDAISVADCQSLTQKRECLSCGMIEFREVGEEEAPKECSHVWGKWGQFDQPMQRYVDGDVQKFVERRQKRYCTKCDFLQDEPVRMDMGK